jgi:hypothetical protein
VLLAAHGKDVFALRRRMAMNCRTAMPFFPVVIG